MSIASLFYANDDDLIMGSLKLNSVPTVTGASPLTLNERAGRASFTGIATVLAGATTTVQLNDNLATSSSNVLATINSQTTAANSMYVIRNIAPGTGNVVFEIQNPTSTATGAAGVVSIVYWIMN